MRVNILDVPNKPHAQAGEVLDLPEAEATDMIRRGAATAAPDEPPPVELPPALAPAAAPAVPDQAPTKPRKTKRG